ncbi:unnamed protein product [Bursaphelenchus xylophilus]|uniref:(pine wood nematode) hypothetical protein n=1 Tax=Bursaphelenchus xylophilus TaxID=6326 RepID=A0A1I7RRK6_BURXY|nr:unnamed protein product [Bursaphelenchus xylophilus]CAG9131089.1 unnamed protein product [Bursaphelenchus xylophilus]
MQSLTLRLFPPVDWLAEMSSYCGAYGSYVPTSGGRLLAKSTYVPQLAVSRDLNSEDDEITEPTLSTEKVDKINVAGDVAPKKAVKAALPRKAPLPTPKAAPFQSKDGFVYSMYADAAFGDRDAFTVASEEDVVTPKADDSAYIQEQQRLEAEAESIRQHYEEIQQRLAELGIRRGSVPNKGKKVGFQPSIENLSVKSVGDVESHYKFEETNQKVEQELCQKGYGNYGDAESLYYGIPNTEFHAYSKPADYDFNPKFASQAVAEPVQSVEDVQDYSQKTEKSTDAAFSQYHLPSLRDQDYA